VKEIGRRVGFEITATMRIDDAHGRMKRGLPISRDEISRIEYAIAACSPDGTLPSELGRMNSLARRALKGDGAVRHSRSVTALHWRLDDRRRGVIFIRRPRRPDRRSADDDPALKKRPA